MYVCYYTVKDTYNIPSNVVSEKATGTFTLRSYNNATLDDVYRRFKKITEGAALMTETTCEITENMHMAAKIPALKLNEEIIRCARDVNAPRISPPRQKTGSTDLGNVMELIPGSCIRVAFVDEHAATHSQEFLDQGKTEQGHNAILYGAKILADVCYDLVTIPGLMDEIKADYNAQKEKMKQEA